MASYTVSNIVNEDFGGKRVLFCRITGDGTTYTTGGDVILPALFGLSRVEFLILPTMDAGAVPAVFPCFIRAPVTTPKVKLVRYSDGAEYPGSANSFVFDVMVVGT